MNPLKNQTELNGVLGESVTMRKINGGVAIKNRPQRKIVADPTEKQAVAFGKFKEAAQLSYAGRCLDVRTFLNLPNAPFHPSK